MPAMPPFTILIVGGGFSGTVLAARLLREPPHQATRIVLVERGTCFGRGLAYAATDVPFLLNVPAGRLSVEPQDPLHFLRFVRQHEPRADAEEFVPRALYGAYLEEVLDQAEQAAPAHVTLERRFGAVRELRRAASEQRLEACFDRSASIIADRIVLAVGNPPPRVFPWARAVLEHPGYVHDPWTLSRAFDARHAVLIVGNGLTMVDVALALSLEGSKLPLVRTISRHGLLPQAQTIFRPTAVQGSGEGLLAHADSVRRVFAASRALARDVERLGGDWREVVTFVRHLAPRLWRAFPERERRRFVRHLQAYWDTHRHRVPAAMHARIEHMRRSGRLEVNAGRIEELVPEGAMLRVLWRRRGGAQLESFAVDAVINATGSDYAIRRSRDPLLVSLQAAGWIRPDPLDLGLATGEYGACLGADGRPTPGLYYLGPMLRADHWEATAALELSAHATALARHLAAGE